MYQMHIFPCKAWPHIFTDGDGTQQIRLRISEHTGMGAMRFSLGRATTRAEIDSVLSQLRAGPLPAASSISRVIHA